MSPLHRWLPTWPSIFNTLISFVIGFLIAQHFHGLPPSPPGNDLLREEATENFQILRAKISLLDDYLEFVYKVQRKPRLPTRYKQLAKNMRADLGLPVNQYKSLYYQPLKIAQVDNEEPYKTYESIYTLLETHSSLKGVFLHRVKSAIDLTKNHYVAGRLGVVGVYNTIKDWMRILISDYLRLKIVLENRDMDNLPELPKDLFYLTVVQEYDESPQ